MIPSAIEKDILIDAPVETVWKVVTEPGHISRWFSDAAEIDVRPDGEGTLTFDMRATNERASINLVVETVEPPHTFAFRWDFPSGTKPHPGNSTRVEFNLAAEGSGTRLRVTESGFPGLEWPDDDKAAYVDGHTKGWDIHLASVHDYVAGQS
jgi:uncharacterized protein YndB with AHSA1/START domain